jgi:hypothetical protein
MTHAIRRMGFAVADALMIFMITGVTVHRIVYVVSRGSVMVVAIMHYMTRTVSETV